MNTIGARITLEDVEDMIQLMGVEKGSVLDFEKFINLILSK
jgi:Ca2+-binding EF-hand superfamily protein